MHYPSWIQQCSVFQTLDSLSASHLTCDEGCTGAFYCTAHPNHRCDCGHDALSASHLTCDEGCTGAFYCTAHPNHRCKGAQEPFIVLRTQIIDVIAAITSTAKYVPKFVAMTIIT